MPAHFKKYNSPHNARDLFEIVADVDKYPEFLPWISSAKTSDRNSESFIADLEIGFKALSQQYTSQVFLFEPDEKNENFEINVKLVEGPFKHLNTRWVFKPIDDNNTEIDFELDFEFSSPLFGALIGGIFEKATSKTTEAFEQRAKDLLG